MPRNMSFAMTIEQVKNQTKTVTRRLYWTKLQPGDLLQPVEKSMGMVSGERQVKIGGLIRVIDVRREPLTSITWDDVRREGFPGMTVQAFIEMFCKNYNCVAFETITRIEFEYV